jgi:uncharacterized protein with HEPN domain
MNDIIRKKWLSAVNECRTHLIRIHQALDRLANRFPLTRPAYDGLDEQDIASVDQVVFRFTKLLDTLGTKIFPLGLQILGEETSAVPFIDQLSRLEQLDFIPSVEKWMELRELRNDLSHEYPDTIEDRIESLNALSGALAEIEKIFSNFAKNVDSHFLKPRMSSSD